MNKSKYGFQKKCAWRRALQAFACFGLLLAQALPVAAAGKLVLKIQAANPSTNMPQVVAIRTSLPERITTNDIINLAGLELGYDVKSDTYFVHGQIPLAPKEIVVREVELNDIWTLDEAELQNLLSRSQSMAGMLESTDHAQTAVAARDNVQAGVAAILARQSENRISMVSAVRHIQAYESNRKVLQEVKQQVGSIENLVLASGMNPGDTLVGEDRRAGAPRRDAHLPVSFGEAVVKITVMNSSATQARKVDIHRELPPEVTIDDVLDAGGLQVQFDPKAGLTYVFADAVDIGPQETKTFDVRLRDKWNINGPRIDYLAAQISELRKVTSSRASLVAVENMLVEAEASLKAVAEEKGPEGFTPAYIAFFRRQADRLDAIEQSLNRMDVALKPLFTKRGFDLPAPDRKTTWLIIYSILGFLAVMSLLFLFRWFYKP